MTTTNQIKDFIEKYDIKNELKKIFEINCDDIDYRDKNLKIYVDDISYEKSQLEFHLFKTSIFQNEKQVGYFVIEYDLSFDFVDDFFVLYEEI